MPSQKMTKSLTFLIILFLVCASCSIDDDSSSTKENLPPTEFEIAVDNLTDRSAIITWRPARDPEGQAVRYQIYLGYELLRETLAISYEIQDLAAETAYTGKIIASDGEKEIVQHFSFSTHEFTARIFNGNVTLTTQEEVNEFGGKGYNIINGSLYLQSEQPEGLTDIDDLTPLLDLIEVKKNLLIRNSSLKNLTGLKNLTKVGGALGIGANIRLQNLSGLEGLRSITEALVINNNELLLETSPLQKVESIGEVTITLNPNLKTVSLLPDVQSLINIYISANLSLQKIEGFEKIAETESVLEISNNRELIELPVFERLVTIGGRFRIHNNAKLKAIGFPKLNSIASSFQILNNNSLNKLHGFQELVFVGGDLHFFLNPKLSDYCNISTLVNEGEIKGSFTIGGNLYDPEKEDFESGNCKL